jgi:hypothetical protein|tara:strand:- start:888 stop:1118 length:231 start_codon:yes stop_codon:yes gene_type:complete
LKRKAITARGPVMKKATPWEDLLAALLASNKVLKIKKGIKWVNNHTIIRIQTLENKTNLELSRLITLEAVSSTITE